MLGAWTEKSSKHSGTGNSKRQDNLYGFSGVCSETSARPYIGNLMASLCPLITPFGSAFSRISALDAIATFSVRELETQCSDWGAILTRSSLTGGQRSIQSLGIGWVRELSTGGLT